MSLIKNKVIILEKVSTAAGWQRRVYAELGKTVILKPTPLAMKIEKKIDLKKKSIKSR